MKRLLILLFVLSLFACTDNTSIMDGPFDFSSDTVFVSVRDKNACAYATAITTYYEKEGYELREAWCYPEGFNWPTIYMLFEKMEVPK